MACNSSTKEINHEQLTPSEWYALEKSRRSITNIETLQEIKHDWQLYAGIRVQIRNTCIYGWPE